MLGNEGLTGIDCDRRCIAADGFDGHHIEPSPKIDNCTLRSGWPEIISVICPQIMSRMEEFGHLRLYCNLVVLQDRKLTVTKLSDVDNESMDWLLSILLLESTPGNCDTLLILLMEKRFRTIKTKRSGEFGKTKGAEAKISVK